MKTISIFKLAVYTLTLISCSCNTSHYINYNRSNCFHFEKRNTERNIQEKVVIVSKSKEFLIQSFKDGLNYYACNLPDSFKVPGTKVLFKGDLKRSEPYEKTIGVFIILNSIFKIDSIKI
jgi:hypothetical protein